MWETLEYGRADVSGEYIVEEEPHESKPNGVTRRLVFLKNQNFVQTEIRMIEKSDSKNSKSSGGKNNQKGKNKKGKGDKSRDVSVIMDFDYSYLDDHHKAVLCSMVLARDIINCGSRVQHSSSSTSSSSITYPRYRSPVGLIIGLGGGAMPMCMQRYLPGMRLYTCEMDEAMHGIAVKFFAFRSNWSLFSSAKIFKAFIIPHLLFVKTALLHDNVFNYYRCNSRSHVIISEGMSLIERINSSIKEDRVKKTLTSVDDPVSLQEEAEKEKEPREQLDFLFIDADSKDPSLGLSAPPGTFITPSALNTFYQGDLRLIFYSISSFILLVC